MHSSLQQKYFTFKFVFLLSVYFLCLSLFPSTILENWIKKSSIKSSSGAHDATLRITMLYLQIFSPFLVPWQTVVAFFERRIWTSFSARLQIEFDKCENVYSFQFSVMNSFTYKLKTVLKYDILPICCWLSQRNWIAHVFHSRLG